MSPKIPVFYHPEQFEFHPLYEWAFGNKIKHPENSKRGTNIFKEIKKNPDLFDLFIPEKVPLEAIRKAHGNQLITLYNTALSLPEGQTFYPSVFPQKGNAKADPTNIKHAGFFCFDSGTPLNAQTWSAATWSGASSYEAMKYVYKKKSNVSYALSRPPGHHASEDSYGGYCYFNNAAICAKYLRNKGKVVILDIDFHHGNGTQDIFYKDDKVFFISIHGDPRDYFPYFYGFQSETGIGKGLGYNLNVILPTGCQYPEYEKALKKTVMPAIKNFNPQYLIVSAGFDTYKLDPIGKFQLETSDYFKMGKLINTLKLPSVILQEGGYHTKDLGLNVVSFLKGFL